ncbi:NBS-LRR disease resistance protein [Trifolium medium]|uniref:NBS-LRR disease resistance protein n=1 Tax=Trifolium medium TaxID=97028 RepID=A0A392MJA8_9FABA|nr:NBS-LRR disease resistance protein [Trifolium medium]
MFCMKTAHALFLDGIKGGWRNLMPEIVSLDLGMNDLVELYLSCISQLRCLVDTIDSPVPNVLSKLVVLEMEEMEDLEELSNGALSFESLNNLGNLAIMKCKHLRSLFKVLLEALKIENCEGLQTIIVDERREDEEIDEGGNNKSHGSMFSKLEVIDIYGCHLLESILPFLSAQDLPGLEAIRIRHCDGLKYVFGQSQHVELVSPSHLELSELPNFIGIFEECYYPKSSCVKGSSSTSKAQIQLDPIKCNIFSWTHICCQTTIPLVVDGDQLHDCSVASVRSFF